jgi:hypothetical protein
MDALKRDAAILRALLLGRYGITIALVAIGFSAFMMGVISPEKRADTFLGCAAFSVVCLVARAASRVQMHCVSAAQLGIPRHASAMSRAQYILIALFTVIPIAFALWAGTGFRAVVTFVGCVAFAIYLMETVLLALIITFTFKGLAAVGVYVDVWAHVFGIPGSIAILSLSAWGIARWLGLPYRIEAQAAGASYSFADSAHEANDAAELDAANAMFEEHLEDVLAPAAPHRLTARRLWIGLGYDPRSGWRAHAAGVLVALAAVVIFHFWKHARWDTGLYLAVSAIFAFTIFSRFQTMNEAWLRTQGEQSILVLSAHWPLRAAFKFALLRSVWTGAPLSLAAWVLFSAAILTMGWIGSRVFVITALGQLAVLVSSLGIFLSYFAHSRVRNKNWLPLTYLLLAVVGTATLLTAVANGSTVGALVGSALLLSPAVVALLAFFLRPTLFPVQSVVRW